MPAIRNNGFGAPYQRIVINLGPVDVKKEGSAFDLPMAVGILGGRGLLAKQDVSDYLMVGELSLDVKLRPVKGGEPCIVEVRSGRGARSVSMIEIIDGAGITINEGRNGRAG